MARGKRPRVGIVGARRARSGLGPFVAAHLSALGAELPCFLVTAPETVASGERELLARGVVARGYTDLRRMLEREALDALAILSPAETHERYLAAALEAELPTLCEKPLLWGGEKLAARAHAWVERFAKAGLRLVENCQWPYALPAYHALHPEPGPIRSFAMRLSPSAREPRAMLGDSLPHPLSLLQALVPGPRPRVERVASEAAAGAGRRVCFDYCAGGQRVESEVRLVPTDRLPREVGFAVNGRWAERRVGADYAFRFADGAREVAVPDPLRELLRAFLAAPEGPAAPESGLGIAERMELIEQIVAAL